jgi:anti-sigma B factor antagonist
MIVEKREIQGHTLLLVKGVVKLGESAAFLAQTLERTLLQESGNVVLDLTHINAIDSTGIGELVGYLGRFRDRKRKLILVNPTERIRRLLQVARLDSLFPIFDSVDEALGGTF